MTIRMFNNGVEVWGMKPVADGVTFSTAYQVYNPVTDEVKECDNLVTLVESMLHWEEAVNTLQWYEVTYRGNTHVASVEDIVHSEFINETLKHMVYRLHGSLRLNEALLSTIQNGSDEDLDKNDLGKHILNCIEPAILNQMTLDQRARAIDVFKREAIIVPEELPSKMYTQEILALNWTDIVFGPEEV